MSKRDLYCEIAERTENVLHNAFLSPRIGKLVAPGPIGEIWVEYDGCTKIARSVSGVSRSALVSLENRGRDLLLLFEAGDPNRPIVVDFMDDPLEHMVMMDVAPKPSNLPQEVLVDGKRITIEAKEEVVLKCGTGSITLRKDGKITIRGTHLLSRASGRNRIKGGSVDIN